MVAVILGACDKRGHPVIVFPASNHAVLADLSDIKVLCLLCYLCRIIPGKLRTKGLSFVANLQKANRTTIVKLVSAVDSLQVTPNSLLLSQPLILAFLVLYH